MKRPALLEWGLSLVLVAALVLRHHGWALVLATGIAWWGYRRLGPDRAAHRVLLPALALVCVGAPLLAPHDPMMRLAQGDLLGLDGIGRDQLSRLLYGHRNSVLLACAGSLAACCVGTLIGSLAALGPRPVRRFLALMLKVWLSVPSVVFFYLGLALSDRGGALTLILLFGLTLWPEGARMLEARIEELEEADFVQTARMGGAGEGRIFFREILPNLRAVWTVTLLITFINAVLLEAVVGYLGLGLAVGTPSLGQMIDIGARRMDQEPWLLWLSAGLLCGWIFSLRAALQHLGKRHPALTLT